MKNLLIAGLAASTMLATGPAQAASDSFGSAPAAAKSVSLGGVFEGRKGGGHGSMPGMGPKPGMHGPIMGGPAMGGNHRWGHRINGRWFVGFYAPGGWGGYRIPYRGYTLPTYWVQPSYRISNYPVYGLYAPQTGFGWSRYYDDAVLTDDRGYVQDYRSGIAWDRYEGGYAPGDYPQPDYGPAMGADRSVYYGNDSVYSGNGYPPAPAPQPQTAPYGSGDRAYQAPGAPYPAGDYAPYGSGDRRYQTATPHGGYAPPMPAYQSRYGFERYERCLKDRGVAGGAIGAVVGAVIGNRVAGRGDRLGGSLLGGGLGALAGMGIEKATNKCKKYLPREDYYYYGAGQQGSGYPTYYPPQPMPPAPQPYPSQGGYYQQGWYYPAPVVTTITVSPAVTTTTTTTVTEEVYYETVKAPAKKRVVKKWRPKPKPRCGCR